VGVSILFLTARRETHKSARVQSPLLLLNVRFLNDTFFSQKWGVFYVLCPKNAKKKNKTFDYGLFEIFLRSSNQSPPPSFFHLLLDSFFFFFFFFFLKRQNKRHRGNKKSERKERRPSLHKRRRRRKRRGVGRYRHHPWEGRHSFFRFASSSSSSPSFASRAGRKTRILMLF
jgi:hypothetical protein